MDGDFHRRVIRACMFALQQYNSPNANFSVCRRVTQHRNLVLYVPRFCLSRSRCQWAGSLNAAEASFVATRRVETRSNAFIELAAVPNCGSILGFDTDQAAAKYWDLAQVGEWPCIGHLSRLFIGFLTDLWRGPAVFYSRGAKLRHMRST
jgi:hypothetical protein